MDTLPLKKIKADENQPRKYFNAERMRGLRESIKREGIISPLVVEQIGDSYLILDGERRFRAATELGLKEVPVIIEKPKNAIERLVRQFTVQEQHESWTPTEKAVSLIALSKELGISLPETCKLLNVPASNINQYVAFAELADTEGFTRSEVPLVFASYINVVKRKARTISETELEEEFTRSDEKKLEKNILHSIKEGIIQTRSDVTKLGDAFAKDPKTIKQFLGNANLSPRKLFLDTGAESSRAVRMLRYNATYLRTYGKTWLKKKDVKLSDITISELKSARDIIGQILDAVE